MTAHTLFSCHTIAMGVCLSFIWPAMAFTQALPQLPQITDISCGASSGKTTLIHSGENLQSALNAASPGDTILLEAGATYIGPITLPAKSGDDCITIRTNAPDAKLPQPQKRISPSHADALAKIVSPGRNQNAIKAAYGAHHYKLMGLEVTRQSDSDFVSVLIELGDNKMTELSQVPHHIELDRVYVHGLPASSIKQCIILNGAALTVSNSYVSECKIVGFDSQAILGFNGPGPFRIINNYLEGAGENVMFGGGDPRIPDLVPSDIEIRHNLFSKPLRWKVSDHSYAGTHWSVKNLFELKNARRVLIDHNIFEYSWADAQVGFAILFTVRNQDKTASWSTVEDVTFINNIVRHAASGVQILGTDYNAPSQTSKRILIKNNLWLDIGNPQWGAGGRLFQITGGPSDVTIEHNTAFQSGPIILAAGTTPSTNFVFRDNIAPHNAYGVFGDGSGIGLTALNKYFPAAQFVRNVLISNPYPKNYPGDNFNAAGIATVGFTDIAAGNYRLMPTSPYAKKAPNKADIGIDWDRLPSPTGEETTRTPKSIQEPSDLQILSDFR